MAHRTTRSHDKEHGNGSNNSDDRFNQLLQAFVQTQTTQNEQQRVRETEQAAEKQREREERAAERA